MNTLQTLDRGLRALDVISQHPGGISVARLASVLEIHRAICYRVVATLEAHALVARTQDGAIRLGAGTAVLAARFEPQLRQAAQPVLLELANRTQATAFVSVAQGHECVVVMVAEPDGGVIRVGYRVGSRHALTEGAAGIAILALRAPSPGDSEEVVAARRAGYSRTVGQLERGAVGIAAGVRVGNGLQPATGTEASVGVVAIDGLDTELAATAVVRAAHDLREVASA